MSVSHAVVTPVQGQEHGQKEIGCSELHMGWGLSEINDLLNQIVGNGLLDQSERLLGRIELSWRQETKKTVSETCPAKCWRHHREPIISHVSVLTQTVFFKTTRKVTLLDQQNWGSWLDMIMLPTHKQGFWLVLSGIKWEVKIGPSVDILNSCSCTS